MTAVSRLRATLGRWAGPLLDALPEGVQLAVHPRRMGYRPADVPPPVVPPATPVRLYVAPVNFAGQGYRWARAAERLPGVGAVSMRFPGRRDLGFPVDLEVPAAVFVRSRRWGRGQLDAVRDGFTHVLVEAERPLFGCALGGDLRREVAALRSAGVAVALVSHGSDLRLPSRHRELDRWSPFRQDDGDLVPVLERQAAQHRALLADLGAPVFVSTPELLLDWPAATWLPTVVEVDRWRTDAAVLTGPRPVALHAPTSTVLKGTDLVQPVARRLHDAGVLEYREVSGVPSAQMPALLAEVDVLVEQLRLGIYGVAAIEAMAAGRLVVGYLHDQVRAHVRQVTGLEVPVVQATGDTLEAVLRDVVARPEHYREVAAQGPGFARAVHDGALSASVLAPFLTGADVASGAVADRPGKILTDGDGEVR